MSLISKFVLLPLTTGLFLTLTSLGCAVPAHAQHSGYAHRTVKKGPGVDHCAERLPAAQERIQNLSARAHSRAETGLSDIVLNCGGNNECFVTIYLDGEVIADLGPTQGGQVAMRCLPAGTRQLRIESVATVLYEGMITLKSDHQHMIQIRGKRFENYATNRLHDRIPARVPTRVEHVVEEEEELTRAQRIMIERARRAEEAFFAEEEAHLAREEARPRRRRHASPAVEPMSSTDFRRLAKEIDDEAFKNNKLGLVQVAARHNHFTSAQVHRLVDLMTYSAEKVEAAVLLYERTIDQENYSQVIAGLTFSRDKETVRKRLGL